MKKEIKILRINIISMVFIMLGIAVVVNFFASRYNRRFDLTADKEHTLADQTVKLLRALDSPLKITLFDKPTSPAWVKAENLLSAYEYHSPHIETEFVDPDKKPNLAKQYGVQRYGTLYFEYEERLEETEKISEEEFTNVIVNLTRSEQKRIYFLEGHGENDLEESGKIGYSLVKDALFKQNFSLDKLLLMRRAAVPEDCAVLVVSGPEKGLLPEELQAIEGYIKRGGKALFMLDPPPGVGLEDFLSQWGVKVGEDLIVDKMSRLFGGDYFMPVVTTYSPHPVTQGFNLATFFPVARSVTLADNAPEDLTLIPLASTTQGSWAEVDYKSKNYEFNEGKDLFGPVSLAVAVEIPLGDADKEGGAGQKKPARGRLIVLGDADFANNTYLNLSGNRDFFLNAMSWLAEEEDLIAVRPKNETKRTISLTQSQMTLLFYLTVAGLPLAVLICGVAVWLRRRKG